MHVTGVLAWLFRPKKQAFALIAENPAKTMKLTFARGGVGAVLNPRAWFDIEIGGEKAGRIVMELRKVTSSWQHRAITFVRLAAWIL